MLPALGWGRPTECHPSGINLTRREYHSYYSLGVTFGGSPPTEGNIFIINVLKHLRNEEASQITTTRGIIGLLPT